MEKEYPLDRMPDSMLWAMVNCAGFAISKLRELELAKFGLTLEQSSILHITLDHGGTIAIKEITDETMRQPNSVYILLNRMQKTGLISKSGKRESGGTLITITEVGNSLLKKITSISLEEVFSVLQEEDKIRFVALLGSLLDRSRYLLGLNYVPPIMKFLNSSSEIPDKPKPKYFVTDKGLPSGITLWSILNGTRFAISRLRELELAKFGLTLEQSSILFILLEHDGTTNIKEITNETMRQLNSVYTLLNRMQKMGIVNRTRKKESGGSGSTLVTITEDGRSLFKKLPTVSLKLVFEPLGAQERMQLAEILRVLIERSRDLLGIPYTPPIMQSLLEDTRDK